MVERESLATRLGFILVSAGCAIGLGNVWRFPFITGRYGGAAFVIVYLVFLAILGFPVMVPTAFRKAALPRSPLVYQNRCFRKFFTPVASP